MLDRVVRWRHVVVDVDCGRRREARRCGKSRQVGSSCVATTLSGRRSRSARLRARLRPGSASRWQSNRPAHQATVSYSESATLLLRDLERLFRHRRADRIESQEIVNSLVAVEDGRWVDYKRGRPLTTQGLAKMLRLFRVKPDKWVVTEAKERIWKRGYLLSDLRDTFARYVPAPAAGSPPEPTETTEPPQVPQVPQPQVPPPQAAPVPEPTEPPQLPQLPQPQAPPPEQPRPEPRKKKTNRRRPRPEPKS
ncbi:MAG: DUF3631 domain-containing protein [Polyangia bacterium]